MPQGPGKELDAARRAGFARVRIDGNMYDLSEEISLERNIKHTVEIVVDDRLVINDTVRGRLADSIETALAQANGLVVIDVIGGEPMMFSQSYACPGARRLGRGTDPSDVQLQQPIRCLREMHWPGHLYEVDPGPRHPRQAQVHP